MIFQRAVTILFAILALDLAIAQAASPAEKKIVADFVSGIKGLISSSDLTEENVAKGDEIAGDMRYRSTIWRDSPKTLFQSYAFSMLTDLVGSLDDYIQVLLASVQTGSPSSELYPAKDALNQSLDEFENSIKQLEGIDE